MAHVSSKSLDNYQVLIRSSSHALLADEPDGIGDGLGPDPYEILLSALAACITITLKLYAKRKEWDLQNVEVDLTHDRVYAKDCKECEQTEGKVERIIVRLKIEGDLDEAQRERIREIAHKCPVHRTLAGSATILHETLV
jgi:putative redox protein